LSYLGWTYLGKSGGELRLELVRDSQIGRVEVHQGGGKVGRMAVAIHKAVDLRNQATRAFYLQLAGEHPGQYNFRQVAEIYNRVRSDWKYVNDPKEEDYFSPASETIANDFTGDCDDFAILLAASVIGIGGEARIALAQAGDTGHAYAEARVASSQEELEALLRSTSDLTPVVPEGEAGVHQIHYRIDGDGSVWVNLDWTSKRIGGPYFHHDKLWIIHPSDGRIERTTLAGKDVASASEALEGSAGSSEPPGIDRVFREFSVMTEAYVLENDRLPPDFQAIAMVPPADDPRVVYSEIPNGIRAQSMIGFGDCPEGSVWTLVASRTDGQLRFDLATPSPACRSLLPDLPRSSGP
jgi:hypothetical protein